MPPNILITSAGRRAKLVEQFKCELRVAVPGGKVYAADCRPELSVACHLADGCFEVPRVDHPDYAGRLLELCTEHAIGMVIPTIDPELPVLAAHREMLADGGVAAVVSDLEFIATCSDKRNTARWFVARGLHAPRLVDPCAAVEFPLFAKPYNGSCSQGAQVVKMREDLTPALLADRRLIFTEYFSSAEYDEFTIDMYYSRDGLLKCLVPRLRIETRAGEVSKGQTTKHPAISLLGDRLRTIPGARGCLTIQVFVHRRTGELYAIEVNPRFGGGYPLSYEAGANFPQWLIQEYLLGQSVDWFDDWENNLTMLRYDDHVLVRGSAA